jgi:hydroxymethylpyrimidine kinase / phosphomethylpyrimidine kinase / thiamine-phosphate diphosphorylase
VALSIAGSDSCAGAGIQADLKTFSALGVYGCTVITAITAQNTMEVSSISEIDVDTVKKQIQSIMIDITPDAIKIGMVYNKSVIQLLCDLLRGSKKPVVLDPIFAAGSGGKLLLDDALDHFISELVPISTLITPNLMEAEKLTGLQIKSYSDAIESASLIKKFGAKNVIIKGCRFERKFVTDVLLDSKDNLVKISNLHLQIKEIHGSGCTFSAAATAFLSKGFKMVDVCQLANQYVNNAIKNAITLGKGLDVSNPISSFYEDANRHNVLHSLQCAINKIHLLDRFGILVPETQSNIVFALPDARSIHHIAGVKGRVIKIGHVARAASLVEFGASIHVASAILAYMTNNRLIRSAMNIKFDNKILSVCQSLFPLSEYDRHAEPIHMKEMEGKSVFWGIKHALEKNPTSEVIYHKGDIGKEPMTIIFGTDPMNVISKIEKILKRY